MYFSGQLSPIPLRAQGSPSPYGLNIPGLDHRGVSPISPIGNRFTFLLLPFNMVQTVNI